MTRWIALAFWVFAGAAAATSIVPMPFEELLGKSSHIVVATIVEVDMADDQGRQILDPEARTGPESPNRIRCRARAPSAGG